MRNLLIVTLLLINSFAFSQNDTCRIYVSTIGNDQNDGNFKKPLKTIEAARNYIRNLKSNKKENYTCIEVILRGGNYFVSNTIEFNEFDSGSKKCSIVYKAYKNEKVVFTGGIEVNSKQFKKVKDKTILDKILNQNAKENLLYLDLKKLGITDYGSLKHHGFNRAVQIAPMELFVDGNPMQLAQYPNQNGKFVKISSVIDTGSVPRYGDYSNRGATFRVDDSRVENWKNAKDFWVQGMFGTIWADDFLQISEFDSENHIFKTSNPHIYGVSGGHFKAINLMEEIDTIGEYYIDRNEGILYFLPPESFKGKVIQLSILEKPFFAFEDASFIQIQNITIECSRGMGVYIDGGEEIRLVGCTIRNLGMLAVSVGLGVEADTVLKFTGVGKPARRIVGDIRKMIYSNTLFDRQAGKNHGIIDCKMYNLGTGGVSLGGGDRKNLIAAGNFIENCEIYSVNRWEKTYRPCVDISGVGNRVSHCEMHDATHSAILFHGNEHIIEYNKFYHTLLESNDVGVIYSGRDPSGYGTIIRYNLFLDNGPSEEYFPHPYSQGIYLDDFCSGTTVLGNIFKGVKTSIFASGWDTKISNNLIIGCGPVTFQLRYFNETTKQRLDTVNPNQPPYSEHYPSLLSHLGKHEQSGWAYGSVVTNNVCVYRKKSCLIFDKVPLDAVTQSGNVSTEEDPLFYDSANLDFRLKPESPVFLLCPDFINIPMEKIGIIKR